jgi:hypothetical protein
MNIEQMFLMQT